MVWHSYILKENLGQCFGRFHDFVASFPTGKLLRRAHLALAPTFCPRYPTPKPVSTAQVDITTIWPDVISGLRDLFGTQRILTTLP